MSYVNTKTMNYASFVSNVCCTICLSQTQRCHSFAMHRLLTAFLPPFTKYTVLCPIRWYSSICRRIENLYHEFVSVRRLPRKRTKSKIRNTFQKKLSTTFPAWPMDILDQMEVSKKGKNKVEREAIEEDKQFVISMQPY